MDTIDQKKQKSHQGYLNRLKKYPGRHLMQGALSRMKTRLKLIELLGGVCVRCGYKEDFRALQIDHINGGGSKDRNAGGNHYSKMREYIKNPEKAKKELQVLCANCNFIKRYTNFECTKYDLYDLIMENKKK